jgi:hypothetical protein
LFVLSTCPQPNGLGRTQLLHHSYYIAHCGNVIGLQGVTPKDTQSIDPRASESLQKGIHGLLGELLTIVLIPSILVETTLAMERASRDKQGYSQSITIG